MRLGDKQRLFALLIAQHIIWLNNYVDSAGNKYGVTLGDAYRDSRAFGKFGEIIRNFMGKIIYGRRWSVHKLRLALDLNLFKITPEGKKIYLTSTESHRFSGIRWETRHPLCKWGGHFNDGNHYSFIHGGKQ